MTTPIDRPNRDAIIQAVDVFRDAMRPFIVRNLRSVHGKQAEDLLKYSMRGSASALTNFEHRLSQSGGIEGAIDLNNIPTSSTKTGAMLSPSHSTMNGPRKICCG